MREISYNREKAVRYADTWALGRNPDYYDFDALGGDCTNFDSPVITSVSQGILVDAHSMNAKNRPLSSYEYQRVRFLHIAGVRIW